MFTVSLLHSISPWSKFVMLLSLMFFGALIGSGLAVGFVILATGHSMQEAMNIIGSPTGEHANWLKWANSITLICSFLLPAIAARFLFGKKSVNNFMLHSPGFFAFAGMVYIFLASAWIDILSRLNEWLIPAGSWIEAMAKPSELAAEQMTTVMLSGQGLGDIFQTVICIVLLPALCEEFLFRGTMQPILAKSCKNVHIAIWATAAVFSAVHFQLYGFLPRLLMGGLLGYLVIWSRSIWTAVLAHAANNFVAVIVFMKYGSLNGAVGESREGNLLLNYVISFILFGVATYYLHQRSKWPLYEVVYLENSANDIDEVFTENSPEGAE